ncbi:MAG: COX15/CtaA family protein [Nocardioides sp.]
MGLTVRTPGTPATKQLLLPLSVANLIANATIIVTGGAVRLTGSGLGCPTWPRCTDDSYVPRAELGVHGAIEFGNRLLTFVVVAVAIGCWLAAYDHRRRTGVKRPFALATLIALGVPAQALIGGLSVRSGLNPWIVSLHLMLSLAMVALCVTLLAWARTDWFPVTAGAAGHRSWVAVVYVVLWLALYLGTVVTGSGPHAGDVDAPRNGLDPQLASAAHSGLVYLLVALTSAVLWRAWKAHHHGLAAAAAVLLAVEVGQGTIGVVQVLSGLPAWLVGVHLIGATLTVAAATRLVLVSGTGAPTAVCTNRK